MGGGVLTASGLSADQFAAAIVAAARVYADDPLRVLAVTRGGPRRCLPAAIAGLAAATGVTIQRCAKVVGSDHASVCRSRRRQAEDFIRASQAAKRAVLALGPIVRPPKWIAKVKPAPQAEAPAARPAPVPPPVPDPAPPPPPPKRRTLTAKAVREAIRDVLHTDNATAPALAEVLNLAEAQIRLGLRELAEVGEVRPDAMTAEGWRVQTWRWVPR